MEDIGRALKERRESLGLTLEEVERSTRIRTNRLEALEEGAFDSLPSEVQLRGFLRNYSDYLGLDPEDLLDDYEDALGAGRKESSRLSRRRTKEVYELSPHGSSKRRSAAEFLISGLVVAAVAAIFLWGLGSIVASLNAPVTPEVQQALVSFEEPTETTTVTPTSAPQLSFEGVAVTTLAESETMLTPTLILPVLDAVRLELTAISETWVRLSVDGEEVFQGRMAPGERLEYTGEEVVELLTGNAGGLRVVFNGQDQGPLGDLAQVVERVWSPRGIVTPAPTITLTPTVTPERSETPIPTATRRITPVNSQ